MKGNLRDLVQPLNEIMSVILVLCDARLCHILSLVLHFMMGYGQRHNQENIIHFCLEIFILSLEKAVAYIVND